MNKSIPLFTVLFLTACVTINVYFPAAAAETVADEIIHGIQGDADDQTSPKDGVSQPQSRTNSPLNALLDFFVPTADAAVNLDIDTAQIRQLRAAMTKRYSALLPYYQKGFIGIKNDGLLTARNQSKIPLKDKNQVNKLVAAENKDRNSLYKAIASANGHPEWFGQIKSTFAASWVDNAGAGWTYQTANGSWKTK